MRNATGSKLSHRKQQVWVYVIALAGTVVLTVVQVAVARPPAAATTTSR